MRQEQQKIVTTELRGQGHTGLYSSKATLRGGRGGPEGIKRRRVSCLSCFSVLREMNYQSMTTQNLGKTWYFCKELLFMERSVNVTSTKFDTHSTDIGTEGRLVGAQGPRNKLDQVRGRLGVSQQTIAFKF